MKISFGLKVALIVERKKNIFNSNYIFIDTF